MQGLCDAFDRYQLYLKTYENIIKANKYARENKLENLNAFRDELDSAASFKIKFDKGLIEEINNFNENFQNTFSEIMDEFRFLIKEVNKEVRL
jgi:MoxR-like ATPase